MNVLFHGRPFYTCEDILPLYRGEHDIRTFGIEDGKQYRYDPVHETFPEVFARISQEWQPDLIVCWGPEETPPPRGIEDAPVPTVAIVSDWDYHYANLEWNLARYDVALMDIAGARHFQRPWVSPRYQFPLYSQTSTIHEEYGERKDIDVLFVGSLAGGRNHVRARYIERLAQLADRYRIIATAGRYGQEYGRLMNRAKIVFNHTIRGELNLRFFETLAAGAAAFIEEDNLECSLYCEDGKNVVLYNERNMLEKIEYYLERPAELEAIARHGHRLAPDFAAENRLDAVIEWAARQPRGARRFRDLPPHEQDYHNVLLY